MSTVMMSRTCSMEKRMALSLTNSFPVSEVRRLKSSRRMSRMGMPRDKPAMRARLSACGGWVAARQRGGGCRRGRGHTGGGWRTGRAAVVGCCSAERTQGSGGWARRLLAGLGGWHGTHGPRPEQGRGIHRTWRKVRLALSSMIIQAVFLLGAAAAAAVQQQRSSSAAAAGAARAAAANQAQVRIERQTTGSNSQPTSQHTKRLESGDAGLPVATTRAPPPRRPLPPAPVPPRPTHGPCPRSRPSVAVPEHPRLRRLQDLGWLGQGSREVARVDWGAGGGGDA